MASDTTINATFIAELFGPEWAALNHGQRMAIRADVDEMLRGELYPTFRMTEYMRDLTPPDKFPGYLARYANALIAADPYSDAHETSEADPNRQPGDSW